MRILVVCGAGASSTFVAQRVRQAAQSRGLAYSAVAGAANSLPIDLDGADVVLVGPHLAHALERIERDAAPRKATVVLLPPDIFTDLDGTRTLALVREAVECSEGNPASAGTAASARPVDADAPSRDADVTDTRRSTREDSDMAPTTRTVRIGSSHGLHARPAKLFAAAAKDSGIPVTIAKDSGTPVNAASILGVISLGVEHGDYVTLSAEGDNAVDVLDELADLLSTDHDAEA